MHKTVITDDEKEILKAHFLTSPVKLVQLKAQAITMRNDGSFEELKQEFQNKTSDRNFEYKV